MEAEKSPEWKPMQPEENALADMPDAYPFDETKDGHEWKKWDEGKSASDMIKEHNVFDDGTTTEMAYQVGHTGEKSNPREKCVWCFSFCQPNQVECCCRRILGDDTVRVLFGGPRVVIVAARAKTHAPIDLTFGDSLTVKPHSWESTRRGSPSRSINPTRMSTTSWWRRM
jgi:hypothetical protein